MSREPTKKYNVIQALTERTKNLENTLNKRIKISQGTWEATIECLNKMQGQVDQNYDNLMVLDLEDLKYFEKIPGSTKRTYESTRRMKTKIKEPTK